MTSFDDLSLAKLRGRASAKWTTYPPDVLPAWVAEMDFPLAEPIKQRLRRAINADDCGYAHPVALPAAFAAFAKSRFGWDVDPSRVRSAPEVMIAIAEILRLVTKPGEGVVINRPVYPPFTMVIEEVGCTVIDAPLAHAPGGGWDLDLNALEKSFADGAKAYVLCNPHNPVGRVFEKAQLESIAKLAKQYNVVVLSDEIHGPLALAGAVHVPFVSVSEAIGADAITITSASKAFNIAGLKCAVFVAGSPAMQNVMKKLPIELPERVGLHGMLANIVAFEEGAPYLECAAHSSRSQPLAHGRAARRISPRGEIRPTTGRLSRLARLLSPGTRRRPREGLPPKRQGRPHARPRLRPPGRVLHAREHGNVERNFE